MRLSVFDSLGDNGGHSGERRIKGNRNGGLLVALLCLWLLGGRAPAFAQVPVPSAGKVTARNVLLPSEKPSGDPSVDTIEVDFYPTPGALTSPQGAPVIIFLGPIGEDSHHPYQRRLATYTAHSGISAAVITLPYHGRRRTTGERKATPALHFLTGDPKHAAQAFDQSASDVSTVVSWLEKQPGVDRNRIGIIGLSLGAVVTHLAMGHDARLSAGVAMLGGGDLPDLGYHSFFAQATRLMHPSHRTPSSITDADIRRAFQPVDPITYADKNRPRHVFMVQGARDMVIPPHSATALWEALGRPPIRWFEGNHFALRLATNSASRAALDYFRYRWSLAPNAPEGHYDPPHLYAPIIKMGLMAQAQNDGALTVTPTLTYQIGALGSRSDHLSVAHADLGLSGRGPFLGAGLTLTSLTEAGVALRLGRRLEAPTPYLSLHFTF